MKSNWYSIAGVTLEIQSESEIRQSGMLYKFLCEKTEPDLSVRLIGGKPLPETDGRLLFSDERRSVFEKDGETKSYCRYFNAAENRYVPYSCLVGNRKEYSLYLDYNGGEVWDTMMLDALDLPNILLSFGAAVMHCSFVVKDGKAILFTADKQVGKSTQASLWEKYANAKIINGDRAAIKRENGSLYAYRVPFCGSSDICENEKVPVAAIVELSQGRSNELSVLSPSAAFRCILGKLTYNVQDKDKAQRAADMAEFASERNVFHLSCLPDEGAVKRLEEELWKR